MKPVVWFTMKPSWEETANKDLLSNGERIAQDRNQTEIMGEGLFRIEVNPIAAPYRWRDYPSLSGANRRVVRRLYKTARKEWSRPEIEWRFSLKPVGIEHWLCIEKWNGEKWEAMKDGKEE